MRQNSFSIRSFWSFARQLTLIELLLVLTILALVSTLTLSSVASQQHQVRFEATLQNLEKLERAILGVDLSKNSLGVINQLRYHDYVSTMGEPPSVFSELWENPTAQIYGKQVATDGSNVELYCGWRGPYLRLPIGKDTLNDGWGGDFQFLDQDGMLISPLGSAPIEMIRSLGADQQVGGLDTYDEDLTLVIAATSTGVAAVDGVNIPQNRYQASVDIYVRYQDQGAGTPVEDPLDGNGDVTVRIYHPDPNTGLITFTDTLISPPFTTTNLKITLGTTIGARAIRAFQSANTSEATYLDVVAGSQSQEFQLLILKP